MKTIPTPTKKPYPYSSSESEYEENKTLNKVRTRTTPRKTFITNVHDYNYLEQEEYNLSFQDCVTSQPLDNFGVLLEKYDNPCNTPIDTFISKIMKDFNKFYLCPKNFLKNEIFKLDISENNLLFLQYNNSISFEELNNSLILENELTEKLFNLHILHLEHLKIEYNNYIKRNIIVVLIQFSSLKNKKTIDKKLFSEFFKNCNIINYDIIICPFKIFNKWYLIYYNIEEFKNNKGHNYFHLIDPYNEDLKEKLDENCDTEYKFEYNRLSILSKEILKNLYENIYPLVSASLESQDIVIIPNEVLYPPQNPIENGYHILEIIRFMIFNSYPMVSKSDDNLVWQYGFSLELLQRRKDEFFIWYDRQKKIVIK